MSTAELKRYVDQRAPEERRWQAQYLWEIERQRDTAELAELDRRLDEMDAGRNKRSWAEASARLDELDRQGK